MARLTRVLLLLSLTRLAAAQDVQRAAGVEQLTLEQALALAREHNRSLANATLQVGRSDEKIEAAKTHRWPQLDLHVLGGKTVSPVQFTFPAGSFGTYDATGPIPREETVLEAPTVASAFVDVTLAQPLTQLHKINLGVKANELSREIDRERLRDEQAAVASTVKTLFYSLLQTGSALVAAEQQVAASRELVRVVEENVKRETVLVADQLDARASLAAAEYRALALRNGLATQKEQLNDLLGRELGRDFTPAPLPDALPDDVDEQAAVARALERRPDLRQARLQVELADADRRIRKADSIPDLSLAFSYFTFANVDLMPRNVAQVGLQLKWSPLDWGRRGKEVAERTLQLEQAKNGAREAEDRVRIDVASRVRKLQEARLLVEANRLARDSARERLRVAGDRQRLESTMHKDVLSAESTLGAAEAQYQQALLGFWTARSDLEKAMGGEE